VKEVGFSIREANRTDIPKLQDVLAQVGLSASDLLVDETRYWLAEDVQSRPVGVVGLELEHTAALLRSAAVSTSLHGQGLGAALVQRALDEATAAGYKHIYLFSTDAGSYWQRHAFREVSVSELVSALLTVPQVKQYEQLGWLPSEVAWRRDLVER
jgi:N-acetylglutamate synthase-like GNAT family acetyltransferase